MNEEIKNKIKEIIGKMTPSLLDDKYYSVNKASLVVNDDSTEVIVEIGFYDKTDNVILRFVKLAFDGKCDQYLDTFTVSKPSFFDNGNGRRKYPHKVWMKISTEDWINIVSLHNAFCEKKQEKADKEMLDMFNTYFKK